MRIHAWRSTPHEAAPRLPLALIIVGVTGIFATVFASSIAGRVLLVVGSVTLIAYALCQLPVHPSPRLVLTT